jgi:hypothetical protein
MLDVHPPHAPTHTWKDFFLHIATISVGLLIAIGLEQTVEFFHHREQRHTLEQQLRAETLRNLVISLQNVDDYHQSVEAGEAQYNELQDALRHHRAPRLLQIPLARKVVKPASAVWMIAQQSTTLALLSSAEAQRYLRVYSTGDQVSSCLLQSNDLMDKLFASLRPALFSASAETQHAKPASYDLSLLSPEQLQILMERLADLTSIQNYCITRNALFYGTEWSAWHSSASDDQNLRIALHAMQIRGGSHGLTAEYPLPTEATHLQQPDKDQ